MKNNLLKDHKIYMNSIKVSVIIPVYNTEAYVDATMESIVNQKLTDIEVIIINDGSTDNSLARLNNWKSIDNRIKIITHENKGQSLSRNEGILLAKGEYIYFMDSDDILLPDALNHCYDMCKDEMLDFAFFNAEAFGNTSDASLADYFNKPRVIDTKVRSGIEMLELLFSIDSFQVSPCLNFINLSFLKEINLTFYPNIFYEDELFVLQLYLQANRVGHIPKRYFKRRIRKNSTMTTSFTSKNIKSYFIIESELMKLKNEVASQEVKALIDRRIQDILISMLRKSRKANIKGKVNVLFYYLIHLRTYYTGNSLKLVFILALSTIKDAFTIKQKSHFH